MIKNDNEYREKLKMVDILFEVDKNSDDFQLLRKIVKEIFEYEEKILEMKKDFFNTH
jgi:antitoxin component HigA of HigAB toxin-antitoxin module